LTLIRPSTARRLLTARGNRRALQDGRPQREGLRRDEEGRVHEDKDLEGGILAWADQVDRAMTKY